MFAKPFSRCLWQDIKITLQVRADIFHKDKVKWRPSLSQVICKIYSDVTWTNRFCYIIAVGSTLYTKYQLYSTKTHRINIIYVRFEVLKTRSVMITVLLGMKLFSLADNAWTLRLDCTVLGDLYYYYYYYYYYYHHHHHHLNNSD